MENPVTIDSEFNRLIEGRFFDTAIIFIFAYRLVKPVERWKAFELGLIDQDGNVLRKPTTSEEKNALTALDRLILKLKHLIGSYKIRLLTAYLLLRDSIQTDDEFKSDLNILREFEVEADLDEIWGETLRKLNDHGLSEEALWNYLMKTRLNNE